MTSHARAVEVDTRLADLWDQTGAAHFRMEQDLDALHRYDGQRVDAWTRKRSGWEVSNEDTEASVRAKLVDPTSDFYFSHPSIRDGVPYLAGQGTYAQTTIEDLDAQRALLVTLRDEERPLVEEYSRDPWPRFFLVQNTGGHIHSSMNCQTTFPTTRWGWLPSLSGLQEADAVAQEGPRLCSICYPSAPVEWTLGLPKAPRCPGSNQRPAPGWERRHSQPCSVCGKAYPVGNSGTVRAHKPAKES